MQLDLPEGWRPVVGEELSKPYFLKLKEFLDSEEAAGQTIFPPAPEVFNALALTPYQDVRVVLLGQDPYHDEGQAHGLCFSVRKGIKLPPSLVNIFRELKNDLGIPPAKNGFLEPWARQGVLMLNAVLTVRAHQANSHKDKGWEQFTDAALKAVNALPERVVFVLWGGYAKKKLPLIDQGRHAVVMSAHPSPLSAHQGFFGSRPFSAINDAIRGPKIDWKLPED